jgi:predicted transport protein
MWNMENFIGVGNGRTYEDFQKQIPEPVKPLFDKLRTYCKSLDDKVIEDVRMHRVVFCKTMTFRWFADLEPTQSSIIIKIQKERKIEPTILEVTPKQKLSEIESRLKDAFTTIR